MLKKNILEAYFMARRPFIQALKALVKIPPAPAGEVKKILVIRIDRMGDLVLSIPVIDNLRAKYPGARITLLVRPDMRELAGMIKSASDVLAYEGMHTMLQVRGERYDIAIDMHYDYKLESAAIAYVSGAPVRAGFAWGERELLFTHPVAAAEPPDKHMVRLGLDLLGPIGVPAKVTVPEMDMPPAMAGKKKMVAMHPGGYYPSQRWGAAKFAELAKRIMTELGEDVILIGGPGDRAMVDDIISAMGHTNCRVAFPGMKDLIDIFSDSKLLVCNNSGPMHLAAALGLPTVSTMGPTDPVLWWPVGDAHVVIKKDAKMEEITVDDMYDAVKKVLARRS